MQQLPLVWPSERPLARRADADSSHAAADRLQSTGRLTRNRRLVMETVLAHPGRTSRELSETPEGEATGLGRHEFARRLADLRDQGRVEGPKVPKQAIRWWPVESAHRARRRDEPTPGGPEGAQAAGEAAPAGAPPGDRKP